jgi:hypothetical protein
MLLESNQPQEALAAFVANLKEEPGRFWSLYGAAQAAERAGDRERANGLGRQSKSLIEIRRNPIAFGSSTPANRRVKIEHDRRQRNRIERMFSLLKVGCGARATVPLLSLTITSSAG